MSFRTPSEAHKFLFRTPSEPLPKPSEPLPKPVFRTPLKPPVVRKAPSGASQPKKQKKKAGSRRTLRELNEAFPVIVDGPDTWHRLAPWQRRRGYTFATFQMIENDGRPQLVSMELDEADLRSSVDDLVRRMCRRLRVAVNPSFPLGSRSR